jgi:hypothetical protein
MNEPREECKYSFSLCLNDVFVTDTCILCDIIDATDIWKNKGLCDSLQIPIDIDFVIWARYWREEALSLHEVYDLSLNFGEFLLIIR